MGYVGVGIPTNLISWSWNGRLRILMWVISVGNNLPGLGRLKILMWVISIGNDLSRLGRCGMVMCSW
jgi:hypothetical protein